MPTNDFSPGKYEWACAYLDDLESGTLTFLHSIDDLGEVQIKIDKYIETDKTPFEANESDLCLALYKGILCVFFFVVELIVFVLLGCWCRGVVIEITDNGFLIYFLDYGNLAVVDKNNVRNISAELAKIAPIAVICQFDGTNILLLFSFRKKN